MVFVDSACSSNRATNPKAGMELISDQYPKYNISEAFTLQGTATSQRAELHAVYRASEVIRQQVMPQRKLEVNAAAKNRDAGGIRDLVHIRLIVATD